MNIRILPACAILIVSLGAAAAAAAAAAEAEQLLSSKVVSVGLFKNGLAIVRREIEPPADGEYRIDNLPQPVHGTFWVTASPSVTIRATTREVIEPVQAATDFQTDLAGRQVTIHFRDGKLPPVSGHVKRLTAQARNSLSQPAAGGVKELLVVETVAGQTYVDPALIAYVEARDAVESVKRKRPVLIVTVKGAKGRSKILLDYLTKGVAWAPSYELNLADDDSLSIRQKAVVKNELEDLDTELSLISGFPHVKFAHVASPLSPTTSWSSFFNQLNRPSAGQHAMLLNVASQQLASNSPRPDAEIDATAIPTGEGADLHYQPIGRWELRKGDALMVSVAEGQAKFERIVEWLVPDTRSANGRHINDYERRQNPDQYEDAAWDAIRFRNPLNFPMTTGPASIIDQGRFSGQTLSYWVSKGEQTTLRVTKALSLRTRSTEHEEAGERQVVYIGGNDFQRVNVSGELTLSNHRNETITVLLRRRFSGELLKADDEPRVSLLEEGVYSVNRRNEMVWTLSLKPGAQKKLAYRYSVLVDR